MPDDPGLLDEVTDLVEQPTALRGELLRRLPAPAQGGADHGDEEAPALLPGGRKLGNRELVNRETDQLATNLLPYFITVRNGGAEHLDVVQAGNEGVLRARYADAAYFFKADTAHTLEDFTPRLATLTFQEKLGSMLDKVQPGASSWRRRSAGMLGLDDGRPGDHLAARPRLFKSDLATQMVVELTSLQGIMGREYARLSGEPDAVAHGHLRALSAALPGRRAAGGPAGPGSWGSPTGSTRWSGCSPSAWRPPRRPIRSACAAMRWAWSQALVGLAQPFDLRPALQAAAAAACRCQSATRFWPTC